jgi:hypothetical protein
MERQNQREIIHNLLPLFEQSVVLQQNIWLPIKKDALPDLPCDLQILFSLLLPVCLLLPLVSTLVLSHV